MQGPRARLVLLKDWKKKGDVNTDVDSLREALEKLPGFDAVELQENTPSTVVASVPARNRHERERLKHIVNERLQGWSVIEEQSYGLPKTF